MLMIQNFSPEELATINRFISGVFDLMHDDVPTRNQPAMLPLEIHRNVEHYETIVFHRIPKQFGQGLPQAEDQTPEGLDGPGPDQPDHSDREVQ
jgi:hypothetical protein